MRKNIFIFIIFSFLIEILFFSTIASAEKIIRGCPSDDTFIYEDTTFIHDKNVCNVEDVRSSEAGVLIIRAHNIVLDCGGMVLNGTGINVSEYPRYRFGILNRGYHNVEVKNCVVQNYFDGILFINTLGSKIHDNTLNSNNNGIVIDNTLPYYEEKIEYRNFTQTPNKGASKVFDNKLNSNGQGINLLYSDENVVFYNYINNSMHGIIADCSSNNMIVGNKITSLWLGIKLFGNSSNNTITGNVILIPNAIALSSSYDNTIFGNIFEESNTTISNSTNSVVLGNYYINKYNNRDRIDVFGNISKVYLINESESQDQNQKPSFWSTNWWLLAILIVLFALLIWTLKVG
jgi:parallel beta-helix repeat protein